MMAFRKPRGRAGCAAILTLSHDLNGTVCSCGDCSRNTADQESLDATMALGTDEDAVSIPSLGLVQQDPFWITILD